MQQAWISLDEIARARAITLGQAKALAEREHWPTVFRLRETLVLAPVGKAAP